ncbi:vitamin K epoxide reductase family protein [Candidatus Woesearchaeota archaeon]|nr:vitamin K epoxide reductase family protein [Candidatus Woesearchaeota archaeon]
MVETVLIASFIVLSTMGLLNAGYLTWEHHHGKKNQPMVCPLNHDCSVVTESRWSHLFGVRNEILGMLFFIGMIAAMVGSFFMPSVFGVGTFAWIFIGAGAGLLFSAALVLIQAAAIKDYCFYCLISAFITLLLFLNSWLVWRG